MPHDFDYCEHGYLQWGTVHTHLNNHKCAVCHVTRMNYSVYSAQSTYVGSQTIFSKSLDHRFTNNEWLLMESEEVAVLAESTNNSHCTFTHFHQMMGYNVPEIMV